MVVYVLAIPAGLNISGARLRGLGKRIGLRKGIMLLWVPLLPNQFFFSGSDVRSSPSQFPPFPTSSLPTSNLLCSLTCIGKHPWPVIVQTQRLLLVTVTKLSSPVCHVCDSIKHVTLLECLLQRHNWVIGFDFETLCSGLQIFFREYSLCIICPVTGR